jgi:hypothetical protein
VESGFPWIVNCTGIEGGFRKMTSFAHRIIVVSTIAAVSLYPLYAHHGAQFLSSAMEMNTAIARLSEMAAKRTDNSSIKDFAGMLARDHNQILDKIKQLRDARLADSISARAHHWQGR